MKLENYERYIKMAKDQYPELVDRTQKDLNESHSKAEDLYILNWFWGEFMSKAIDDHWDNWNFELFTDDKAMMPMPESVAKQFVNMLFDIKNLDVLYDMDIYDGFNDYEYYKSHPDCDADDEFAVSKEQAIADYESYFSGGEE